MEGAKLRTEIRKEQTNLGNAYERLKGIDLGGALKLAAAKAHFDQYALAMEDYIQYFERIETDKKIILGDFRHGNKR